MFLYCCSAFCGSAAATGNVREATATRATVSSRMPSHTAVAAPALRGSGGLLPSGSMASKQEVEGAETLTDDTLGGATPTPTPKPFSAGPPVEKWDRYELGELLGKGGMGAVYKARDRRLGRTVAIKLILGADPNLAMRFLQEARAQARIDHPNVCRV